MTPRASAAKRGRNPKFPWVPIIDYGLQTTGVHRTRTEQLRAKAFANRADAVAYAQRTLDARAEDLRRKLADPRYRALREQHGLPREL